MILVTIARAPIRMFFTKIYGKARFANVAYTRCGVRYFPVVAADLA
jgi:hypothetical protein